ncbi:MAG: tRNA (adenosine(37)-N6)-dimethylallyltransferase MiaA, partial [Actinobacteria bacterium]|nr:tRNA (adenosine(37)-N6)-dimethylallyltransferase MiaA [Actinomycetota bacterium]
MSLVVICGATATGKSDLAIALAKEINAEIINGDSMQLYRGMDIGTAKLPVEERGGIQHHLLDVLDVTEDASVAWYQERAREIIEENSARGKSTVIVGGTGLYIKAILDDLNFPDTDPAIRANLNQMADKLGAGAMHERLAQLDPAAALAIDSQNLRRVIRALEVIAITGEPFTANLPRKESTRYPRAIQFGLVMDREKLDER